MNDLQKKYTVLEISKCKSQAEDFDKKAQTNRWFIYGSIVLFIICSQIKGNVDLNTLEQYIVGITQCAGIVMGIDNLRRMIENMCKKSGLENMATNLEYQLEYDNRANKEENNYKGHRI